MSLILAAQPSSCLTKVNLFSLKGHTPAAYACAFWLQAHDSSGECVLMWCKSRTRLSTCRWHTAKLMPGAHRLLWHLHRHGIPVALATSTSRATFGAKMAGHGNLQSIFACVSCGDEVQNGKPAPDCFREAAKKLGLEATECLAIEDAPAGVESAVAAGMRVAVVPSLRDHQAYPKPLPDAPAGA